MPKPQANDSMRRARASLLRQLETGQIVPRKVLLNQTILETGISKRWLIQALDGLRYELGYRLKVIPLSGRGEPVAFQLGEASNPLPSTFPPVFDDALNPNHQLTNPLDQAVVVNGVELESANQSASLWEFIGILFNTIGQEQIDQAVQESTVNALRALLRCPEGLAQSIVARPEQQAFAKHLKVFITRNNQLGQKQISSYRE